MISSSFDPLNNTFKVILDSQVEVSGTFKVITVRSNALCALNFHVECNKHDPPADSSLGQTINFMAAQHEILKKLSDYAFSKIQADVFPVMEVENTDDKK